MELTQKILRNLLDYNHENGMFTWKEGRRKGRIAGNTNDRYMRVKLFGKRKNLHRLAVLYMTGETPKEGYVVDHINGDKHDNRWGNLRVVTNAANTQNQSNARGFVIVDRPSPYRVTKTFYGKSYSKSFKTQIEAEDYVEYLKYTYAKEI